MGPRPGRAGICADAPRDGVPDARLPEPDRPLDELRRAGGAAASGRALRLGDPLTIPFHQIESGTLLIFAFWFTVWKGFRKLAKDKELEPHQQGFFEGAAASLVAFAAAGFVGSSFTPVPEQSFLWLAVGMMFGVTARRQIERDRARRLGRKP